MAATNGVNGVNGEDLLREAQAGTLKRNGTAAKDDPIAEAFVIRKNLLGQRIMEQSVTEMETATIRAENERLNALIEQQKLQQAQQPEKQSTDQWQEYLLGQMERLREQLATAQQEAQAAQQALLQQRLDILMSEMNRIQQQPREDQSAVPADPIEQVSKEIARAKALLAEVTPPTPAPVLGYDPQLEKWKLTMQAEDRERERQFQREQLQLQQTLALQREEAIARIAREDKVASSTNKLLDETAPQAIKIFVQFMQGWMSKNVAGDATAIASAVAPAPRPAVRPPPGIQTMNCPECGSVIPYKAGMSEIICPACYAVYADDGHGSNGAEVSGDGVQSGSAPEQAATA